jgi:putative copper export protein
VACLPGLALANRALLLPRLDGQGQAGLAALAALERNVALEQLLGLLVLVSVSVLGLLPPAAS